MHKTLLRQIQHAFGEVPAISPEWKRLLSAVSITYEGFDKDRTLIERSLEISSTELKGLIALLQATLDSINEGILVVDKKNKIVNHNKRFIEICQIPEHIMKTHDNEQAVAWMLDAVTDPDTLRRNINRAGTPNEEGAYIFKFKDGRTVEMNSKPQIVERATLGRVWSFRDVSDVLRTEEDLKSKLGALERLNKSMIDRELKMIQLKEENKMLRDQMQSNGNV